MYYFMYSWNQFFRINKANLRYLIAATGLEILVKLDSNHHFLAHMTLKFDGWPWKIIGHIFSSMLYQALCIISKPSKNSNWSKSPETPNSGQNLWFFCPVWPWNLIDDLEKNRIPLLCYFKLCVSFDSHRWIQTRVTFRKRLIWDKIVYFLPRVTLKFDGWPWKTIELIFYIILRQALCMIQKPLVNSNWSYSPEMPYLGQNRLFFALCDPEIWRLTLKKGASCMRLQALCVIW